MLPCVRFSTSVCTPRASPQAVLLARLRASYRNTKFKDKFNNINKKAVVYFPVRACCWPPCRHSWSTAPLASWAPGPAPAGAPSATPWPTCCARGWWREPSRLRHVVARAWATLRFARCGLCWLCRLAMQPDSTASLGRLCILQAAQDVSSAVLARLACLHRMHAVWARR